MKGKIRNICDLLLGLLFVVSVIAGYYKDISHMSEYCFISGMFVGCIFIVSFVYGRLKGKALPTWLYFDCMVTTIVIFIATIAIGLNLEGAFWFIHIINPIVLLCYWLVFCNHTTIGNSAIVVTDIVFPMCYFAFAFILWKRVGICPFPASLLLIERSAPQVSIGMILVMLLFIALGYALHFLNRLIYKKR